MTIEQLIAKQEIRELVDEFSILAGNLRTAGFHSFKREVAELNAWYQRELQVMGVDVRLGEEATPDKVAELGADAVVIAAGSVPVMPRSIPGIDHAKAMSCNVAPVRHHGRGCCGRGCRDGGAAHARG